MPEAVALCPRILSGLRNSARGHLGRPVHLKALDAAFGDDLADAGAGEGERGYFATSKKRALGSCPGLDVRVDGSAGSGGHLRSGEVLRVEVDAAPGAELPVLGAVTRSPPSSAVVDASFRARRDRHRGGDDRRRGEPAFGEAPFRGDPAGQALLFSAARLLLGGREAAAVDAQAGVLVHVDVALPLAGVLVRAGVAGTAAIPGGLALVDAVAVDLLAALAGLLLRAEEGEGEGTGERGSDRRDLEAFIGLLLQWDAAPTAAWLRTACHDPRRNRRPALRWDGRAEQFQKPESAGRRSRKRASARRRGDASPSPAR
jgi:hypothetical protein